MSMNAAEKCAEFLTQSYPQHIQASAKAAWAVEFERIIRAEVESLLKAEREKCATLARQYEGGYKSFDGYGCMCNLSIAMEILKEI